MIGPDGRYALEDVPIGPARIAVVSHPRVPPALLKPSGPTRQAVKPAPPRALRIPERYRDAEKSGLTCTVQGGSQTHDIVLRP